MHELTETYQALEEHVRGGPRPDFDVLQRLAGSSLLQADEHTVAQALFLAALSTRLQAGPSITPGVRALAQGYREGSFLYTGRLMARFEEMIALLDRTVEERDPQLAVDLADHLSQGWPGYADSVFPAALARLAAELGFEGDTGPFATTSFTCWRKALELSADGHPDLAAPLFEDSLRRYRHYLYFADAAWLYADVVITQLTQGQVQNAARTFDDQSRYVAHLLSQYPEAAHHGDQPSFQVGDIQSGGYSTFVESLTLYPQRLAPEDRVILRRYVRTSELLLAACRYNSRRDFDAALDLFSFGWSAFPDSAYPRIFQHLASRCAGPGARWNVQLTASARWHRMLRAGRVSPTSHVLIDAAVDVHDRLVYAGMGQQAGIVLLDAAVMHAHLYGRNATVEWISRYVLEIRAEVPELLQAAVDYLQTQSDGTNHATEGAGRMYLRYVGLRSQHAVPDFSLETPSRKNPGRSMQVEVALYDGLLSIEGITVYEHTPEPLVEILLVLGDEFSRSQAQNRDVPHLSAAELSARTGRTAAALAQNVRRLRNQIHECFQQATTFTLPPEAVVQGRPGYRLNPASVMNFHRYPAQATA